MFVAVTALGIFLGWTAHRVGQRNECLRAIEARGGFVGGHVDDCLGRKHLPLAWRLFGAKELDTIQVSYHEFTREELNGFQSLFPDAFFVEAGAPHIRPKNSD